MNLNCLLSILVLHAVPFTAPAAQNAVPAPGELQLMSVRKIWDAGQHNAFTDLIRFEGKFLCAFRESEAHIGGNGMIRVLSSGDGEQWKSVALIEEPGIDLRDPKLSITPDGRLMMVLGGSVYQGKTLIGKQSRVSFSKDGREWTPPRRVLDQDDWLWRVTWHAGRAYGILYTVPTRKAGASGPPEEWTVTFVESADGIDFQRVKKLAIPGRPNEATLRFRANGEAVALLRREAQDKAAWIGVSRAPFTDWQWQPAGLFIGGPNFLELPDGRMFAGGRQLQPAPAGAKMFVGSMTATSVTPELTLPSGGDCSYPGFVWHEGVLWASYYSSHEGRSSIYLAKIQVPEKKR